ncbi:unnamed protein product, partial [Phaeothamnion confervicola]
CSICLDEVDKSQAATLDNCSHLYCYTCILKWSEVTNRCPCCK